ncbi:hypothetical protein [Methylovulum psychrotolerans]|uniref:Uncharacterized protein n=1 Tax=Methylovulum psychrotolerans TaxID=1704499 RepID=A0A2S5CN36_9GAMM|nr:hypothetical protein [Methylovulum psychrotolerans]POZ52231.1 hypothetical protein AADEFJLK_01706 [Methylovulum psychrotolerans]
MTPEKVTVFNYESYDIQVDEYKNHGKWATMEYITRCKLIISPKANTLEVSLSDLDSEGRYIGIEAKQ